MVYAFARQSGGHIRIDSRIGGGTTVCLYLPRNSGVPDRVAADVEETILVVDDESAVRGTPRTF
jgi:chemotaxis protein histidine kinase CheA